MRRPFAVIAIGVPIVVAFTLGIASFSDSDAAPGESTASTPRSPAEAPDPIPASDQPVVAADRTPDIAHPEVPSDELALPDRITGVVRESNGSRIPNAKVRLEVLDLDEALTRGQGRSRIDLRREHGNEDERPRAIPARILATYRTMTNDVGEFEFRDLPRPAPDLTVLHRERITAEKSGFVTEAVWARTREPIAITLREVRIVRGVCLDIPGESPIAGARLVVSWLDGDTGVPRAVETTTGPDGAFEIVEPIGLDDRGEFTVQRQGGAPRRVEARVEIGSMTLRFPRHPPLALRILEAGSRRPLEGVVVTSHHDSDEPQLEERNEARYEDGIARRDTISNLGFSLGATDAEGELRIDDLGDRWGLLLEGTNLRSIVGWVQRPNETTSEPPVIEIEKTKVGFVRGRVVDELDRPRVGIEVDLAAPLAQGRTSRGFRVPTDVTDDAGRFEIEVIPDPERDLVFGVREPDPCARVRILSPVCVRAPGEVVDLGAVRHSIEPLEAVAANPTVRVRLPRFEVNAGPEARLVEIVRRPAISDSTAIRASDGEFVGFARVDETGRCVVEVLGLGDSRLIAYYADGYDEYVVGSLDGSSIPPQPWLRADDPPFPIPRNLEGDGERSERR